MNHTINSYESAHACAYKLLNLATELLGDNYTLIQLVKWSWDTQTHKQQSYFNINYRGFTFTITKNDYDMFNDKWYQSAAEEIVAWLLLQKGVSKTKSKQS